jgi:hypothetical protein
MHIGHGKQVTDTFTESEYVQVVKVAPGDAH